jgi:aromatic-L-amino-acid decarboxylase
MVASAAMPKTKRGDDRRASEPRELEIGGARLEEMILEATRRIVRHIDTLDAQPMHRSAGAKKVARSLREPIPTRKTPFPRLMKTLFGRALPLGLNTASGGYLAYIPGGGLPHAAVADLVTSAVNRYVGVWLAAPGLVQIEANAVDWLAEIAGMPEATRGGVLTTGGSMANLVAVVTARRTRLPDDFSRGVIYASSEAHHSVVKAALLAGFSERRVRVIDAPSLRLPPRALEQAIRADRAEGLVPLLVVASGGTTSTGSVDDLGAIADVAARDDLWLHVDAAYGGFFRLTERGRAALAGIERADSVTLDPHKGLFLPYGTGCLVVRDKSTLRRAHAVSAHYLPPMQTDADLVDFCELSPELSREARGVRIWLPLKMHGVDAFRAALDEKLDLARELAARVSALPHVRILEGPSLSLFAFRHEPPGMEGPQLDAHNRRVLSGINARQRVHVTGAVVGGRFALRACVLSFRTHAEHTNALFEDLSASLAEASARP